MGVMVSPSRFLFNMDFTEPEEPEIEAPVVPEVPMMSVAEHERRLAEAKAEAFEEARVAALNDLLETQEKLLTDEVTQLAGVCEGVLNQLDEVGAQQEKEAIGFAFLVARRLCAHLLARQPMAEILSLVSECLAPLRRAPHLVIRVAERDVEALETRIEPIVREKGFEGRLVILGEADIARGDCHIEWAEGGIRRDRKALEAQIDGHIKNYILSRSKKVTQKVEDVASSATKETEK
ncbi:MAG: flagellar assembly protein FliH [Rhodobacteraceae bacterium]|nr:flagellar assembly protein FliH [Paracoccaceae bacterium]